MNNYMSRNERLWDRLVERAAMGMWTYQTTLYPSEIERIVKQWNVVVQKLRQENENVVCLISWNSAFSEGINIEQSWYISKLCDEIPQVKTPAQQLFLIAARA